MQGSEDALLQDWDHFFHKFSSVVIPSAAIPPDTSNEEEEVNIDVENLKRWNLTKPVTLAWAIQQLHKLGKLNHPFPFSSPSNLGDNEVEYPAFRVIVLGANEEESENAIHFWSIVIDCLDPDLSLIRSSDASRRKGLQMELDLIGPQVSAERHGLGVQPHPRLTLRFHRDKFHEFREERLEASKYTDPHLFIAFHSGFHFYKESWSSTLVGILNDGVVACFTSHDVQDEKKQWTFLRDSCEVEEVMAPQPNPFGCFAKFRHRPFNDRIFAIKGLPDSLYVYSMAGPKRLDAPKEQISKGQEN